MASPIAFHPRYSEEPFDGFAGIRCHLVHNVGGAASVGVCTKEDQRYRTVTMGGLSRMLQSWNWPVSPAAADLLQQREHHRVSSLLNATNKREGKSKRKNESVIATETTTTTTSGRVRKGVCIKHTHTHYTLLETHIKDLPKGHGFRKASGLLTNPNKSLEEQKGTNMRRYSSCLSSRFFCDDMTLTAALCSVTFHGTSGTLRISNGASFDQQRCTF